MQFYHWVVCVDCLLVLAGGSRVLCPWMLTHSAVAVRTRSAFLNMWRFTSIYPSVRAALCVPRCTLQKKPARKCCPVDRTTTIKASSTGPCPRCISGAKIRTANGGYSSRTATTDTTAPWVSGTVFFIITFVSSSEKIMMGVMPAPVLSAASQYFHFWKFSCLDGLLVSVSASHAEDCRFMSRPRQDGLVVSVSASHAVGSGFKSQQGLMPKNIIKVVQHACLRVGV